MGASDFFEIAEGDDPEEQFHRLSAHAEHRNGAMYSGQINMKDSIERRKPEPLPKEEALAFARDDRLENEKWGPAFYVEYYETEDRVEEVEVRLGALTEEKAREKMKTRAKNQSSLSGDLFADVKNLEIETSGSLPDLERHRPAASERERNETWIVQVKARPFELRDRVEGRAYFDLPSDEYESKSEARESIKEYYRKHPTADVAFVLKREWTDEIEHFGPVVDKPSSKPMWSGTVSVVERGGKDEGDGFIFYGMASE